MGKVQSFEIAVGASLRQRLAFHAYGVSIDNYSNQWIRERNTGLFVPPLWQKMVIPLTGPTVAELNWEAPQGITQPGGQVGTVAEALYLEDDVAFSPGVPVPTTASPHVITDAAGVNVKVTSPPTPTSKSFAVPPGADGFTWTAATSGLSSPVSHYFKVVGDQSATTYVDVSTSDSAASSSGTVALNPADTSVTLTVVNGFQGNTTGTVSFTGAIGSQTDITDRIARLLGQVVTRPQLPDGQANAEPAANAVATATVAASAGKRHIAQAVDMSLGANAATAVVITGQILDGATAIFSDILGTTAAIGASSRVSLAGALKIGTVNTSMSAQTPAAGANMFSRASISTYLGIAFGTPL